MGESDYENDYALVFDHFYTTNHIQILKSLLPFLDTGFSSYLPVLIKYLELQHTLKLAQKGMHPTDPGIHAASRQTPDWEKIYQSIKKYLAPDEERTLKQILDMMHTMKNVKEMQKMMDLFQNMNGEENGSSTSFPDLSNLESLIGGDFNTGDMMQFFHNMTAQGGFYE